MLIRPEAPSDAPAIRDLTTRAFAPMRFSDGTEAEAIDRLRADGDLFRSLVAIDGGIVGHVAFSSAQLADTPGRWFALGPISVAPERQGRGIGSALIEAGLAMLRVSGAAGCVLVGDPAYYGRFGFRNDLGLTYAETPAVNVMGLALRGPPPTGEIVFAAGLR